MYDGMADYQGNAVSVWKAEVVGRALESFRPGNA